MEFDKIKARAKNNAYMLLRMRPRSESEIRSRLKLKGYGEALIEGIVGDLKRTSDINDEKFARFWVESRMHMNPAGSVVLKHELKRKGVSDAIIKAALEEKEKNYDEYELALNMGRERFERLKKLDRSKAIKRLYDFMLRRGFAYETVRRVTEAVIGQGRTEE